MIKKFKFYNALWHSFYNMDLYVDIFKNWKGFGFKYLIFLSLMISSLWTYNQYEIISEVINNFKIDSNDKDKSNLSYEAQNLINIISQFPIIYIKDGEASTDENLPQPYYIRDAYDNIIAIIDTSTNTPPLNMMLVIGKNQMSIFDQVRDLSMFGNITIDQQFIIDSLKKTAVLFPLILIIFTLKITFIHCLKVFFITILLSIISDMVLGGKIGFKALFRATVIALIPSITFEILFSYIRFLPRLQYMHIISYFITIAYMISALVKFKQIK